MKCYNCQELRERSERVEATLQARAERAEAEIELAIEILDCGLSPPDWTDRKHSELIRKLGEHIAAYDARGQAADAAEAHNKELVTALEWLLDEQNGIPLERRKEQYTAAVNNARAVVKGIQ